jgi:ureidoglycolate hydrolase
MLESSENARTASLWISNGALRGQIPFPLKVLERHPHSPQTFIPLDEGRYLVVACHSSAEDEPDLATLRAFIATSTQIVTFAQSVWHHPLTILDGPMEFAVAMTLVKGAENDEFFQLTTPLSVEMQQAN